MKVSLIVPVYNEEKYIGKLLDSILFQSYKPDEIIICDNNSTDKTLSVIKKFKSSLPIRIVTQTEKGIRPTVEKAWRSASGEIILKTDADCILPKNWVKNIVHHFQSDNDLSACGGNFFASDGSFIMKILAVLALPFIEVHFKSLRGHRLLFGGNFAIRRSVLISVNGYEIEDVDLPDDQLICQKLNARSLKHRRFYDCWNYTSIRSFNSLSNTFNYVRSAFNPRYYREKSI